MGRSRPRQHHYLPRRTYLAFFEAPGKPGSVWMYRRGEAPLLVSTGNVGKERDLYTLKGERGQPDTIVEETLAGLEGRAAPLLGRLNAATGPVQMTVLERLTLLDYLSVLAVRTPAHLSMLDRMVGGFQEMNAKLRARIPGVLEADLAKLRESNPEAVGDMTAEELRDFILKREYEIGVNREYLVAQSIRLSTGVFRCLVMKQLAITVAVDGFFVTSDHPVVVWPDPKIPPFYRGGFLTSDVFVPIGSRAAVMLHGRETQVFERKDQVVEVPAKAARGDALTKLNTVTAAHAERFLLASTNSEEIRRIFDETTKPKRVRFSGFGDE